MKEIIKDLNARFINESYEVNPKKWQAIDSPMPMRELLNVSITYPIPSTKRELVFGVNPNLPWADTHFEERVGGKPLNPGESYKSWPFYKMDKEMRREGDKFSHTYMERFWPKYTGELEKMGPREGIKRNKGIRYQYGDLLDVVNQLAADAYTRQAYLPIFFPEDTGNLMNQRVPCSIGYHFIMRDYKLHIIYYIRSCDYMRHFKDDVYQIGRAHV